MRKKAPVCAISRHTHVFRTSGTCGLASHPVTSKSFHPKLLRRYAKRADALCYPGGHPCFCRCCRCCLRPLTLFRIVRHSPLFPLPNGRVTAVTKKRAIPPRYILFSTPPPPHALIILKSQSQANLSAVSVEDCDVCDDVPFVPLCDMDEVR